MSSQTSPHWLAHTPITLFSSVMGLSGLSIAWQRMGAGHDLATGLGLGIGFLALMVFATVLALYLAKWAMFPTAVRQEFAHPVRKNFFPAASIGLILLSMVLLHSAPAVSQGLWWAGISLHTVLTLAIMASWMQDTPLKIELATPAWFIPVVGNILIPIAGVAHGNKDLSWYFFSIGLVFWPILATVMFNRLFFHPAMPAKLLPTLFILIAPPAVGTLSWLALHDGQVDAFAKVLYFSGLFTTLLLLVQIPRFARLSFGLSWWAYTFPMTAITTATFVMAQHLQQPLLLGLSWLLLALSTVLIASVFLLTLRAMVCGQVFVAEH